MQHSIRNFPTFCCTILFSITSCFLYAQLAPSLLKDINVAQVAGNPQHMLSIGNTVFFSASQGFDGRELWKTQGGGSSTLLVSDINPMGDSEPANFCNVNGTLFFSANNGMQGVELWKSDGTNAGTNLVRDIVPNGDGSNPTQLTACNGKLFFTAIKRSVAPNGSVTNVVRIYVSDGTTAGTKVLNEVLTAPKSLTAVGNTLFFVATSLSGTELWKTDGTLVTSVKDINTGVGASSFPQQLINVAGTLFFSANDGPHGRQLWRSNGTVAGTVPMTNQPGGLDIKEIAQVNGKVFFSVGAGLPQLGNQIFRLKDNAAPLMNDIFSVANAGNASNLTAFNNALIFVKRPQLGASILARVALNGQSVTSLHNFTENLFGVSAAPQQLVVAGTTLYFTADSLPTGRELWKSNGTVAGTVLIQNFTAGNTGSSISGICPRGNEVFFAANSGSQGSELHRSTGALNAIDLVRNIGRAGSSPEQFTHMITAQGNRTFFTADNGVHGRELWITDGSEAGTLQLKDIVPGALGSNPKELTVVTHNNVSTLFFVVGDISGILYKSDGTAAGTKPVQDVMVGGVGTKPNQLVAFKGELFYHATNVSVGPNGNVETKVLFRSNGTTAGTKVVSGFLGAPRDPKFMKVVGEHLFFSASDTQNGREFWKYNGVIGSIVKNIRPGSFSSDPSDIINVGGTAFFIANDGTGRQLFKSNGTSAGTQRISNWHPFENPDAGIQNMTNFAGVLHFTVSSGTGNGDLMFKTNAGLTGITEAAPGMGISYLKASGQTLFFIQFTEGNPTPVQLKKLQLGAVTELSNLVSMPFSMSASPIQMTAVGGQLYFVNPDTIHGYELWKSDGTVAGTKMIVDLRPGIANSHIRQLTLSGSNLLFSADNLTSGDEPFILSNVVFLQEEAEARSAITQTPEEPEVPEMQALQLKVYPNPATDYVHVDLYPATAAGELNLLTLSGQIIRSETLEAGTEQVRFDLQDLPKSVYLLRWKSDDGRVLTRQIMVQ